MNPSEILGFFLAFSFLFFGISCLFAPKMKAEFERYNLSGLRRMTGVLQILGSVGLFTGMILSSSLAMAALAGLSLLMFLGVMVRIKIRDPWPAIMPALLYSVLCGYLFFKLLSNGLEGIA
jgi:hypothetical protein